MGRFHFKFPDGTDAFGLPPLQLPDANSLFSLCRQGAGAHRTSLWYSSRDEGYP